VDVGRGLGLDASVSRPSRGAVVPPLGLASELPRSWYASASSRSRALKGLVSVSPRLELSTPRSLPRSRASRSRSREAVPIPTSAIPTGAIPTVPIPTCVIPTTRPIMRTVHHKSKKTPYSCP